MRIGPTKSILLKLDVCPSDRSYLVHFAHSTPSPLTRLPSGALRSAGETGEWGRNADTDVYAPHMVLPLQRQHASQQCEAYHLSITPAAGRAWCDPATCGLCRHRYALGMLALTHRLLASRCLRTSYTCRLYSICSRRSGLAPLSLSARPAILGRRVSLRVWV